mmetsp:Transcript_12704/g.36963  ORF Transcript_12704/g.36963 Transcript_12704/m.36963 type:complete len:211 (+) Transcript_12704:139-771(+)
MAPIHIPRALASIARGMLKPKSPNRLLIGLGPENPHIYNSRAGLFDVDYLGHMNNAAFLAHAEYARWELTAENELLNKMYNLDTHFVVSGAGLRYRREIRPIFRKFTVDTYVGGLDHRHLWVYQTFRCPDDGNNRIRAQVLIQGVAVKDREVVDPRELLKSQGYDPNLVDSLCRPSNGEQTKSMDDMMRAFEDLDASFRASTAADDATLK